jgi:hypothetical protein
MGMGQHFEFLVVGLIATCLLITPFQIPSRLNCRI